MKEWSSPYNPFNSVKILLWRRHLEAIVNGNFLPPITTDTDPTNQCNFNCIWCNSKGFRKKFPGLIPPNHLLKLADFYKEWGVKSTCVAGGGEPLMNPGLNDFIERLKKNGVGSGVITNGSLMTEEHIKTIAECSRWCGFSMDAGTQEHYIKVKGINYLDTFNKVIGNIRKLARFRDEIESNLEVTYKYLIHPLNYKSIYEGARLAKKIGVDTFHLRPVCWDNLYDQEHGIPINFEDHIDKIDEQILKARDLEDEKFKVYGVRHKFGEKFKRKVNFKKCLATPLLATFSADGNVHLCFDVRGKKEWLLCRHYPDPREILNVWGGEKHKKIIDSINPEKCPRCTFGPYNEIIEKVIIEDRMTIDFP